MSLRFVHPPRTGGSSLKRAWGMSHREYKGHRLPAQPKPADEWRYGFTRNPWDRVVSLWCLAHPTDEERTFEPFRAWVLGGMVCEYRYADREQWAHYSQPTLAWLAGADFVGRFERRDADLQRLAEILGRPFPMLPDATHGEVPAHLAASRDRGPYADYYDDETVAWVAERYADDIEAFAYSFGGALCTT